MFYGSMEEKKKAAKSYANACREAATLYPQIAKVFRQYDGKVYNCRLEKALQAACEPVRVFCEKRYNYIEVYTYTKNYSYHRTLAHVTLDSLKDGKRICADTFIESAQAKRAAFLKEAADMERTAENMETILLQLKTLKKTYNKIADSLPSQARDIWDIKHIY